MLQQTQVDRVLPFYERFMATFPDERALAHADDDTLHRLWKGLGYPSRAERLRATCYEVLYHRDGVWPDTPEGLQQLPGIGPYTAGAVACFAFARAVPVDTTARVKGRCGRPTLKRTLAHAADQVSTADPIAYNSIDGIGRSGVHGASRTLRALPVAKNRAAAGDEERHAATGNRSRWQVRRSVTGGHY